MAHEPHTRSLPAELNAPQLLNAWKRRALTVGAIFAVLSVVLAALAAFVDHDGIDHLLRSYLLGYIFCWGLTIGGLAMLMVQYVSGGKWGLLLRRPLEAMSRNLPLVIVLFLPVGIFMKKLYLWAQYSNPVEAFHNHLISAAQEHAIAYKHPMLNITSVWIQSAVCFAIWFFFMSKLNKWGLQRDADTHPNVRFWQVRLENLSGFGILIYSLTMTVGAIDWVMSLDPTWYSSIWGLLFLVGQGYAVLAVSIITVIRLSKAEPMHTMLRVTEQHDLGKFTFAFVMLNIYLAFSQFLIIWSGNLPEEIPWYLDRIRGGWGVIASLDFVFHWFIPFTLLLSRDLKRNKERLVMVCKIMIFARCWDLFWLIEPNFADARRNLHFSFGILEYMTVPVVVISIWMWSYFNQLEKRPLVQTNDPHLEQILEADHAHA
ncbi:MAG TPA: hypothetical protein VN828_11070 [Acidobacteriaceae bacterium]|nr:hypothetical protein [Acidobacteriaceae bacterium]